MRTTVILKEEILKKAMELTSVTEKTALIHMGLEALIEKVSRERLIALAGTEKGAKAPDRRRN